MQEKEDKIGQTSLFLPYLRHIIPIQTDIIINVSFKHWNVKLYHDKKTLKFLSDYVP